MVALLLLHCALVATATDPQPFAFSNTIGSHAVIEMPLNLWGTGTAGAPVEVNWGGKTASTTVAADGLWRLVISDLKESMAPIKINAVSSGTTITLLDILVGKVILCSGQSNVDLVSVSRAFNASAEVAAAAIFPNIRIARTQRHNTWSGPLTDVLPLQQKWAAPNATNIAEFSATCWFSARDLFLELGGNTPIGVIQSAAGGTAVRNWIPEAGLSACSQPWAGLQKYGSGPYTHSTLYNSMIAPFGTGPTSFSFVLWDQAESDSYPQTNPGYYGCATLAHVNSWRELLKSPSLPWFFVHLQPYTGSESGASELEISCGGLYGDPLAELRHNQLNALQLSNTGFASAIDLGDPTSPYGNVHFQNKQVVSKRIVSAAMHVAFGKKGGSGGTVEYPPAQYLNQVRSNGTNGSNRFKARVIQPRVLQRVTNVVFTPCVAVCVHSFLALMFRLFA
jgi:sialate O-acetylesterase